MPSLSIEPVQKPPKTHLLINRNFALLWSGRIISQTGDFFLYTTLILWVATSLARNLPWTPLAVSGVTLALTLPTLLVGPLAGVFVDRWDRRRTMLRMDLIRAGLLTLLLLATGLVPLPFAWQNSLPLFWKLGAIYCALILVGACSQFFSTLALIGEIVPERLRTQATGFSSITINFALVFWGIIISLFARLTTYIPGLVAFFLLGAFNAGINVTVGPLLLKVTPREFVGRVASVLTPAITLASLLSAALAGYLVSNPLHNLHAIFLNMSFGPLDTVFTIEGLLVVCAGIHALIALSPAQTGLNEQ